MNFIPHIVEAKYIKDYIIEVKFNDGSVRKVNLEPYTKRQGIFSQLKSKEYFRRFFIDLNTLCWPNGADIAPERLYELNEVALSDKTLAGV